MIVDKDVIRREALYFYELQDFKSAKTFFNQYIDTYGHNEEILILITFCELDEGNLIKALEYQNILLEKYNNERMSFLTLGLIAWKKRDYYGAVDAFKLAISKGVTKELVAEVTVGELLL
jgi:tetratricopeptide (TPR) repeat protein